ncbi:MAG: HDOD domain-containing protein [Pseudomonadota bacterium]
MLANDNVEAVFLDELYSMLASNTLILPTLPEIAIRIRDLAEDERSSLADIGKLINKDPALAARVVQIANSPAFRTRSPFNSVDVAVMRLGGAMIKNIVTGMVMEQLFQSTTEVTDHKLRTYWHHATEVSERALELARPHKHLQLDQAMLAGLIHDIGVLPIIALAEDYPQLLVDPAQLDRLIAKAHLEIGTAILKHWNFSEELIAVGALHENMLYEHEGPVDYVELIIVANLLSDHKKADLHQIRNLKAIPAFNKFGILTHPDSLARSA